MYYQQQAFDYLNVQQMQMMMLDIQNEIKHELF
jgi:hypothetical protein